MSNEDENLCAFADEVAENYDCQFNIEIGDDKFKFDLTELVTEIRKSCQVVIDDIENLSDDEKPSVDKHKSIFDEMFVPEFTTKKTSGDEITMSDFDYFRKDMPDTVKKVFDLLLPLSIFEEAEEHEKLAETKSRDERIKAIEMYTMLRIAQIAVS